jgi:hypothetical protein
MKQTVTGIFYNDIQFFRFYKDGVFLDCLIRGYDRLSDIERLCEGFQRENMGKGVLQGIYTLSGKKLTFSTLNHLGDNQWICYEGEYKNNHLILNSLDHNTGRRIKEQIFMRC